MNGTEEGPGGGAAAVHEALGGPSQSTATESSPSNAHIIPTAVFLCDSDGNRTLISRSSSSIQSCNEEGDFDMMRDEEAAEGSSISDSNVSGGCFNNNNSSLGVGTSPLGRDGGVGGHPQQLYDSTTSSIKPQRQVEIVLDEQEHKLFDVIHGTIDAYRRGILNLEDDATAATAAVTAASNGGNNRGNSSRIVTVRVAGGWVRDKILGMECHDVDVAIDCMTGVQFAQLVQRYVLEVLPAAAAKPSDGSAASSTSMLSASRRIGVISARPEQSKHLETATMKLCGLDVDFLNLRGQEKYQVDSRIPVTSFGTPLEDAERRDFTMNSLFYNLATLSVEDWLGRGIDDLRRGILVTPLDALDTFRDDPLRVLRAIRFAVRYQFDLDDNLRRAAMHPEIHKALHVKISRERVGKELEGMLSGKLARPVQALQALSDLKLAGSVFCLPLPGVNGVLSVSGTICNQPFCYEVLQDAESDIARQIRSNGWQEARCCLDLLPDVLGAFLEDEVRMMLTTDTAQNGGSVTKVDLRLLPVAAFVLPMRFLQYRQGPKQPQREWNAVSHIMREGLKFKNADCNAMALLMESVDNMASFLQRRLEQTQQQQQQLPTDVASFRLDVGMMLRNLKDSWVTCLCLAIVVLQRQSQYGSQDGEDRHEEITCNASDWLRTARDVYRDIMVVHKLDRSWTIRPLLDGATVATVLQVPKGPLVARYLREQVRWMLLHPDGTREACEAHLSLLHKRGLDEMDDDGSASDAAAARRSPIDDGHHLGASDGTGKTPSSPVSGGRQASERHFSKKIHVESMDLS